MENVVSPDAEELILCSDVSENGKSSIASRREEVRQLYAHILNEDNPVCSIDKYTNENN